jgi:hypothetical protein
VRVASRALLRREQGAFERLVDEKKHMVMPAEVFEAPQPGSYINQLVQDTVRAPGHHLCLLLT